MHKMAESNRAFALYTAIHYSHFAMTPSGRAGCFAPSLQTKGRCSSCGLNKVRGIVSETMLPSRDHRDQGIVLFYTINYRVAGRVAPSTTGMEQERALVAHHHLPQP